MFQYSRPKATGTSGATSGAGTPPAATAATTASGRATNGVNGTARLTSTPTSTPHSDAAKTPTPSAPNASTPRVRPTTAASAAIAAAGDGARHPGSGPNSHSLQSRLTQQQILHTQRIASAAALNSGGGYQRRVGQQQAATAPSCGKIPVRKLAAGSAPAPASDSHAARPQPGGRPAASLGLRPQTSAKLTGDRAAVQSRQATDEATAPASGTSAANNRPTTDGGELSSLEQSLPVEVSFLVRQQALCMARINNLNRQLRELRELQAQQAFQLQVHQRAVATASQSHYQPVVPQVHYYQDYAAAAAAAAAVATLQYQQPALALHVQHAPVHQQQQQQPVAVPAAYAGPNYLKQAASLGKSGGQGHFMVSDDSGGEYSRATMSEDDELSSLLDQIAKRAIFGSGGGVGAGQSSPMASSTSVSASQEPQRHEFHSSNDSSASQQQQHTKHRPAPKLSLASSIQPTLPVASFVMQPQFAAPQMQAQVQPSTISSTVLPGVHFQPRFNQYYDDLYLRQAGSVLPHFIQQQPQLQPASGRLELDLELESKISTIEELVNKRERRQIKSQSRTADNWLKMQASNLHQTRDDSYGSASATQCKRQPAGSVKPDGGGHTQPDAEQL